MAKLSAIQLHSVANVEQNIENINAIMATMPIASEHLVVLPEACLFFGGIDKQQLEFSEPLGKGVMQQKLAALAKQYSVYLLAGTIPLQSNAGNKITASSLLFSPSGECLNEYQKIHLFDVDVNDSEKQYRESQLTTAGNRVCSQQLKSFRLGMTVCYDLRFPELFRALAAQKVDVIAIPSAFTKVTGKAHWQTLLQARAIENQVYIIAAGQYGDHANGRQTWGHSMIINPWGDIIALKEQGEGFISADFDRQLLTKIRTDIPIANHNKFSVSLK